MGQELSGILDLENDLHGSVNIPVIKGDKGDKGDPGNDGHSPVVTATKSGGVVSIKVDGTEIATVADGVDGHSPVVAATKTGKIVTISVDGTAMATVNDGADGIDGQNGQDGHSPVVTASKSGKTTTISVDGTPVATITDGSDGQDGSDGHSPVVTASKSGKVVTISVDGTAVATITDGEDGQDGQDGQDGHSPVITATKSGGVTTISVDGTAIAAVSDGTDGTDGQDGHSPVITGSKSGTITTISADGAPIATINDGDDYVLTESDKSDIAALVDVPVSDVTINGTSVVNDGVAEIPIGSVETYGAIKIGGDYGIGQITTGGRACLSKATSAQIKAGVQIYKPIVSSNQHESTFYGLAKIAGANESASTLPAGQYTDTAKAAIKNMLGVSGESQTITVSGTTPTITAQPNTRYICGEVLSLDFTPCASGICNVVFTSGSTVTVLNLPNTVKLPEWFEVETNTTYEISIMDGVYGAVMSWGA